MHEDLRFFLRLYCLKTWYEVKTLLSDLVKSLENKKTASLFKYLFIGVSYVKVTITVTQVRKENV